MYFSDLSWSIRGTLGRKFLALAQQYDDARRIQHFLASN